MSVWLEKLKTKANQLKGETYTLYLAYRHPATPRYAKIFAGLVVGYAFSPALQELEGEKPKRWIAGAIIILIWIALAIIMVFWSIGWIREFKGS